LTLFETPWGVEAAMERGKTPVGIGAKKAHVVIVHTLTELGSRPGQFEERSED